MQTALPICNKVVCIFFQKVNNLIPGKSNLQPNLCKFLEVLQRICIPTFSAHKDSHFPTQKNPATSDYQGDVLVAENVFQCINYMNSHSV